MSGQQGPSGLSANQYGAASPFAMNQMTGIYGPAAWGSYGSAMTGPAFGNPMGIQPQQFAGMMGPQFFPPQQQQQPGLSSTVNQALTAQPGQGPGIAGIIGQANQAQNTTNAAMTAPPGQPPGIANVIGAYGAPGGGRTGK